MISSYPKIIFLPSVPKRYIASKIVEFNIFVVLEKSESFVPCLNLQVFESGD